MLVRRSSTYIYQRFAAESSFFQFDQFGQVVTSPPETALSTPSTFPAGYCLQLTIPHRTDPVLGACPFSGIYCGKFAPTRAWSALSSLSSFPSLRAAGNPGYPVSLPCRPLEIWNIRLPEFYRQRTRAFSFCEVLSSHLASPRGRAGYGALPPRGEDANTAKLYLYIPAVRRRPKFFQHNHFGPVVTSIFRSVRKHGDALSRARARTFHIHFGFGFFLDWIGLRGHLISSDFI